MVWWERQQKYETRHSRRCRELGNRNSWSQHIRSDGQGKEIPGFVKSQIYRVMTSYHNVLLMTVFLVFLILLILL